MIRVKFKKLRDDAIIPTRAHSCDAGLDLYAAEFDAGVAGLVVKLGIASEIPPGYCALIVGRSGMAKKGVDVLGGLIDAGYRGEWAVMLAGDGLVRVEKGQRVAQAILLPVPSVEVVVAEELAPSERGEGGFGSTGA